MGIFSAEVGDFPIEEYADHTYLRANNLRYIPNQTEEIEKKIMEYHKQHVYVFFLQFMISLC
jgi:hypothetical protein